MDERLETLLEAHAQIEQEYGVAQNNICNEWAQGHANGLREASNRIESMIHEASEAGE